MDQTDTLRRIGERGGIIRFTQSETTSMARRKFEVLQARACGKPDRSYFYGSLFNGSITRLLPNLAYLLTEEFFKLPYLRDRSCPR